jgi:choice-of-anchor A domain-containing protein
VNVRSGKIYGEPVPTSSNGSFCGRLGRLSGKLDAELTLGGDVIMSGGPGTTAATFRGYKEDGLPSTSVFIDGDVATGGGTVKSLQYVEFGGGVDTTGAHPEVAICRQAVAELSAASATLASLSPTQVLTGIAVNPGQVATLGVGPGRQVVNVDTIVLDSSADEWSELDIVLDPATVVVVINVAKMLVLGAGSVVAVNGDAPVIFNLPPRARLKLKKEAFLGAPVLAPAAKINIPDDAATDALFTTLAVKLKGASVESSLFCP